MYSEKLRLLAVNDFTKNEKGETAKLLNDFCVADDLNKVKASDVYRLYCEFCSTKNITPPTPQSLGRAIADVFKVKKKNVRFGNEVAKVYYTE